MRIMRLSPSLSLISPAIILPTVIPQKRGRGYASLLMMEMIEKARQENRRGVILTCKEKLIPFYEQFGFVNKGLSASVHGGAAWYDMVLDFEAQPESGF